MGVSQLQQHMIRSNKELNEESLVIQFMLFAYIFLSFFEVYLTGFIGNSTKYVLLLMIGVWMWMEGFRIKINSLTASVFLWFFYKIMSISWSSMVNNDVRMHMVSQIGMVLFVTTATTKVRSGKFLQNLMRMNYLCSFLFGILSILSSGSYQDNERLAARQVLTLWGRQNDPNNCSAFLAIGIALAAYSLLCEKRNKGVNLVVIAVNTYAIILTGSRGGFLLLVAIVLSLMFIPNWSNRFFAWEFVKRFMIVSVAISITVIILNKFTPTESLTRLLDFEGYEGGSGRSEKWGIALELIRQRPFFGWGWGGYTIIGISAVHNTYLTMLCDVGMLGTLLFFVPIFVAGIYALKNKYLLALIFFLCGLFPALSIDSINKRYFWNAIIIGYMLIQYNQYTGRFVGVWQE